jgi:hypothetical protein
VDETSWVVDNVLKLPNKIKKNYPQAPEVLGDNFLSKLNSRF